MILYCIICLVLGVVVIYVAVRDLRLQIDLKKFGVLTEATVVKKRPEDNIKEGRYDIPLIEYEAEGQTIRTLIKNTTKPSTYNKLGKKIPIKYHPKKTSSFLIQGDKSHLRMAIFLIPFGIVIIALGLWQSGIFS